MQDAPWGDMKQNFLTSETHADIVIALNCVILTARLFSLHFPNVLFDPGRLSSRFVEYMFQYLRIAGAGHNMQVSVLSGLNKLRTYNALLEVEGTGATGLPDMVSKRGMPRSKERIQQNWSSAPAGYYPASAQGFVHLLDEGVAELHALMQTDIKNGSGKPHNIWQSLKGQPSNLHALGVHHLVVTLEQK